MPLARTLALSLATLIAPLPGCDSTDIAGRYGGLPGGGSDTDGSPTSAEACRGTLGPETVENVNVPAGATCTLDGTVVQGNVFVRIDARLFSLGATVGGNIQAENAERVEVLSGTSVGGNVQANQGGASTVVDSDVDGDVQLEQNRGPQVVEDTRVGGNMQVNQNSGGVFLNDNVVEENLQCQANSPAPVGAGNLAGDKEDQCEFL
jgi:hypothetical protein